MSLFERDENCSWTVDPRAAGPFRGLQGGAVAALMVAELEQLAAREGLGLATSVSVEFLRPTPVGTLRTEPETLRRGRRGSVLLNTVFADSRPTARATVCFLQLVELEGVAPTEPSRDCEPAAFPLQEPPTHDRPWLMDCFEVRRGGDAVWFRALEPMCNPETPMARVLGPADWAHGLARPPRPRLADPNVNLQVTMLREPVGEFIGVQPRTIWAPSGIGLGEARLRDAQGAFGRVAMSVALAPFPGEHKPC